MDVRDKYRTDGGVEVDDNERLDAILARTKFNVNVPPEKLPPVFYVSMDYKDYPVAYPGSLGLMIGAQKVRKTTALKAIAASALGGKPVINFSFSTDGGEVVFFDTEQRYRSFWETQNKVLKISGLPVDSDRYSAHTFIDETIDDRLRLMERVVNLNPNIKMIVIDGALDMLEDYNNIREARTLAERIARMANKSKSIVFVVIHASGKFGKGPANSLGHLGSELERKCDFALQLTYNKDTQFTEVEHLLSRDFGKFPNFEFTNDREGNPVLDHNDKSYLSNGSEEPIADDPEPPDPFDAPFTNAKVFREGVTTNSTDVPF